MKAIKTIASGIIMIGLLIVTASFLLCQKQEPVKPQSVTPKGFAVMELFTSEGCSSCPPADRYLEELQQQDTSKQLFILAYHVDYWDHQGWKDRFSSREYTDRQKRYADLMQLQTIYTPQLVVNGTSEYVGSDKEAIAGAVTAQIQQANTGTLALECTIEGTQLQVKHNAVNVPLSELVIALVQKHADSRVMAGENAGRSLAHVQVVSELKHVSLKAKSAGISLPSDFDKSSWEVIGFVQNTATGEITNAARFQW